MDLFSPVIKMNSLYENAWTEYVYDQHEKNADIVLKYNSKLLFMLYIDSIEVLDFHITSASHRTVFGN